MKILIVEDNPERIAWFASKLKSFDVAKTAVAAIELVINNTYDFIFLDHDLDPMKPYEASGPGTGYEVALAIAQTPNADAQIIIHSFNPVGAVNMQAVLPTAQIIPFGMFDIDIFKEKPCQQPPLQ